MHRKRVTSELHDSYFRLMTIKHPIQRSSSVRVGVELLFNSVEFGSQSSCQQTSRELETRCGREGHTRPRGSSEAPMEWTPESGEQERHNVSVITVGSKYEVYVRSPAPSHMQTLEQTFRTLAIKWEVNIIVKKSSCVFIMRPSFLRFPSCVFIVVSLWIILHIYVHICRCESAYMTI